MRLWSVGIERTTRRQWQHLAIAAPCGRTGEAVPCLLHSPSEQVGDVRQLRPCAHGGGADASSVDEHALQHPRDVEGVVEAQVVRARGRDLQALEHCHHAAGLRGTGESRERRGGKGWGEGGGTQSYTELITNISQQVRPSLH